MRLSLNLLGPGMIVGRCIICHQSVHGGGEGFKKPSPVASMQAVKLSANVLEAIEIIQTEAGYLNHSVAGLEAGLITFSTQDQVGFIAGLLHKAHVPEEWRLLVTGILLGRTLRSSKDTSLAEMSALISWLLGDNEDARKPCEGAKAILSDLAASILGAAALTAPGDN